MSFLLIVYRLLPASLTGVLILQFDLVYSALAILLMYLINKLPNVNEDLGRVEHKLDSIAKETLKDNSLITNYGRLHETAWDDDYPMKADDLMIKGAKKRLSCIMIAGLISEILWLLYLATWAYLFWASY